MKQFSNVAKKSLIATGLVGLTIAVASNANASVSSIIDNAKVYIGAGVGYNQYGLHGNFKKIIENDTNKGSIKTSSPDVLLPLIGVKLKDNFGLEFGYAFHKKLNVSGNRGGSLRIRNAFLDLMGYMPVSAYSNFDLIGGLGIGRMAMAGKGAAASQAINADYNKFGFRAKFGTQYNFDDNWGVRGLVGYQQIGRKDNNYALKNSQFVNIDVLYLI